MKDRGLVRHRRVRAYIGNDTTKYIKVKFPKKNEVAWYFGIFKLLSNIVIYETITLKRRGGRLLHRTQKAGEDSITDRGEAQK